MYKINFTKQAARALQKIPRSTSVLIREKLSQIASDPFAPHHNIMRLQGRPGYRLRVGDWRIIYEINKDELVIIILKIAPRGEVYQ